MKIDYNYTKKYEGYALTPIENPEVIDLRELLQTLKKRKKMILLVTLVSVLLAVAYVFVSKPVYQVQAMIEIGQIDKKPLDEVNTVKQKLEYIYGVNSKKKRVYPKVKSISVGKKSKSTLMVAVEGHNNADASRLMKTLVDKIEKEYADKVRTYTDTQKELISLIKSDIALANTSVGKIDKTLENYNQKILNLNAKDAALAGIYTMQISQNQERLDNLHVRTSALKAKVYTMEMSISPLKIKPTHIVGEVEVLDKPIKPKKALILIVALITGLMLAIFLAFFLEFLKGLKASERTKV